MSDPQSRNREPIQIREGHGRLPWWGWVLIVLALIYAFLIGPFNWFPPQG